MYSSSEGMKKIPRHMVLMRVKWLLWRILKELVTKDGHLFASFMPVASSMCIVHPVSCLFMHTFSLSEFQMHSYKVSANPDIIEWMVWCLCKAGQFWNGYGGKSSFSKSEVIFSIFFFFCKFCVTICLHALIYSISISKLAHVSFVLLVKKWASAVTNYWNFSVIPHVSL